MSQTDAPEPHRGRASRVLRAHPEIKALYGRNPWTALITVAVVVAQVTLAWLLRDAPWWAILAASWGVGAFFCTALYGIQHELAHHLVFRNKTANRLLSFVANAPWLLPAAVSYHHFHLVHHSHQGVRDMDPDLPAPFERWLGRLGAPGKLLVSALFPFAQVIRTANHPRPPHAGWLLANVAFIVVSDVLLVWFVGPAGAAYLLLSFYFSMALHPLAGRFIQEHHVLPEARARAERGAPPQETNSYYGPLDGLLMHVGHHNEHHDFPFVAWNRLPEVRATAPEVYDAEVPVRSWTRLWLRYLFGDEITPSSRVVRSERGRVRAKAARTT